MVPLFNLRSDSTSARATHNNLHIHMSQGAADFEQGLQGKPVFCTQVGLWPNNLRSRMAKVVEKLLQVYLSLVTKVGIHKPKKMLRGGIAYHLGRGTPCLGPQPGYPAAVHQAEHPQSQHGHS